MAVISAEGESGFEQIPTGVIGIVIGFKGNLSKHSARAATKLWKKAILKCPQSRFSLMLMHVSNIDDDSRRYVRWFARLTGLDQPETAHKWLSVDGLDFLQSFGVVVCPCEWVSSFATWQSGMVDLSLPDQVTLAGITVRGPGIGTATREVLEQETARILNKHGVHALGAPKTSAAIHEAAHVRVHTLHGDRVTRARIRQHEGGGWIGYTECPDSAFDAHRQHRSST
jgi:hypothetical protein